MWSVPCESRSVEPMNSITEVSKLHGAELKLSESKLLSYLAIVQMGSEYQPKCVDSLRLQSMIVGSCTICGL